MIDIGSYYYLISLRIIGNTNRSRPQKIMSDINSYFGASQISEIIRQNHAWMDRLLESQPKRQDLIINWTPERAPLILGHLNTSMSSPHITGLKHIRTLFNALLDCTQDVTFIWYPKPIDFHFILDFYEFLLLIKSEEFLYLLRICIVPFQGFRSYLDKIFKEYLVSISSSLNLLYG